MNVRLERNGEYWRACWLDHDGRRRYAGLGPRTGASEAAARRLCMELERKLALAPDLGKAPTLGHWLGQYLDLRTDLSPATVADVKTTSAYLIEHFTAAKQIEKITRADAAAFRASMARRKLGEQTIRKHMRNCRSIFGRRFGAAKLDLIPFNPFDREIASVADVDRTWNYLTLCDLVKILEHCPDESWRAMLGLCRLAGLRRGEVLRLGWSDIDFDAGRLHVRHEGRQTTKGRARVVPLGRQLADILSKRFAEAQPGEAVFAYSDNNLTRNFQMILKCAEIPTWSKLFHTLRKNCETDWLAQYPVMDVCSWLGHAPRVAAKHYHQTRDDVMLRANGQGESEVDQLRRQVAELEAKLQGA